MAVYEGARPRAGLLPRRRIAEPVAAPALPRRRIRHARGVARAGRRRTLVGAVLTGIVVAFVMAFFTLTQSVHVAATGYDVDRLTEERDHVDNRILEIGSDLNRLGRAPAIRKLGRDAGLDQLPEPMIVPVR
jgi:hypothetical protein